MASKGTCGERLITQSQLQYPVVTATADCKHRQIRRHIFAALTIYNLALNFYKLTLP